MSPSTRSNPNLDFWMNKSPDSFFVFREMPGMLVLIIYKTFMLQQNYSNSTTETWKEQQSHPLGAFSQLNHFLLPNRISLISDV